MSSPSKAGGVAGEAAGSAAAQDGDVTHPMKAFASELSKLQGQVQALQSTKLQEQVIKLRESVKGETGDETSPLPSPLSPFPLPSLRPFVWLFHLSIQLTDSPQQLVSSRSSPFALP